MTKERASSRQFCSDHCMGCGQHFHGIAAFDRHRMGGTCAEDCDVVVVPSRDGGSRKALQAWTNEGYCRIAPGCWENGRSVHINYPVTVWQAYQTPEQRERLASLNRGNGT
jgi:hypothetical protein